MSEGEKAPDTTDQATVGAVDGVGTDADEAKEVRDPQATAPADDAQETRENEFPESALISAQLRTTEARLREVSKAFREQQDGMQAFRERAQSQAEIKAERQAFEAVRALLEPVQNLGRSIEAPGEDTHALIEGLQLVHRQFRDALESLGLEPVPGKGAPFNPNVHEAIAVSPVEDEALDNKVLEVLQPGFMVKGKVLHAAQVVIGQYSVADDVEA